MEQVQIVHVFAILYHTLCSAHLASKMDLFAKVGFATAFCSWLFVRAVKGSRSEFDGGGAENDDGDSHANDDTTPTILFNVVVTVAHLVGGIYEHRREGTMAADDVISAATWILGTIVAFCSKQRSSAGWPTMVLSWWIVSCVLTLFSVSAFFLTRLTSVKTPVRVTAADIVDFTTLPLCLLLCFNAVKLIFFRIKSSSSSSALYLPLTAKKKDCSNKRDSPVCFASAGIWSRMSFSWLNPLLNQGLIKKLELSDVPSIPESETAEHVSSLLEESMRKMKIQKSSKLPLAVIVSVWKSMSINAAFAGINATASYIGPFLITNFVNFLYTIHDDHYDDEDGGGNRYGYGLALAFFFFLAKMVESLTQRQLYFGAQRIGIRVRAALTVLIYKKSLMVARSSGAIDGEVVNLINVDVERIGDFCLSIHAIWLFPFQVFFALAILYKNLGARPSAAALCCTILVIISTTPLQNMHKSFQTRIMEARDRRIKATSETLKTMRVLKLQSWEAIFLKKLLQLREIERKWLRKYHYTSSIIIFLFWASPTLISVITFGTCVLLATPLTTGMVFSTLATFRILQDPIYNLPELISMTAQAKVSFDRIEEFINKQDQTKNTQNHEPQAGDDVAVDIETGEYSWETRNQSTQSPTIRIIEKMKIKRGCKVAICGPVGSGKSSLLCSIIHEIPRVSGAGIEVYGTKAYVPQIAWIQTGTVRENVLFGKEMNQASYEEVLEACALNKDIKTWISGDLTVVGETGANLSGGQKQRIQLARALYSNSDICILDDPFSAVDAHTGTHLFKKCLLHLLSQKTVIYATHQLEFLYAADIVLVMKEGMIVQSGRYGDLVTDSSGELVRQISAHRKSLNQVNPFHEDDSPTKSKQKQEEIFEDANCRAPFSLTVEQKQEQKEKKREEEEEGEIGRVKWRVYSTFITSAYKGSLVPVILLCQILFQALQMGSTYWIAWATDARHMVTKEQIIKMFAVLSGGSSIFVLARTVLLATIALETSQRLFLAMIKSIFQAPISFFCSTPSSRILARSSTDQSTIDTDIPYRLAGLAFALIQLMSIIIFMSHLAWQVFLLFLVIIGLFFWYQRSYTTCARELARMLGIMKAPILHHFSESIAGAITIRCFKQEEQFLMKNTTLINRYSRIVFHNSGTMEWFCVRINLHFNLVFFIVLVIFVNLPKSIMDPSLAGLAIIYGFTLSDLQGWVIWNLCNVKNKMIAVERILQFANIPSQPPLVIESCRPNPEWPTHGRIEFSNLHVQYGPMMPMILKGINCVFPGAKKIAIVGRTGSGKSTLIQALFRVIDPSGGKIIIDGLDISGIGLQDLRSRLGIIPQDPILFLGTIRNNLDPLNQHLDQELWKVLNKCHLANIVKQDQRHLDAPVSEDGQNWSVGQRQLLCLARVLLKKRKILVLDEATASIDIATDNIIQETIREETSMCTVITVAHRIATVIDNDLVLVLDEGKVVEYDSPTRLLEDTCSSFSKLVMEFLRRSSKR